LTQDDEEDLYTLQKQVVTHQPKEESPPTFVTETLVINQMSESVCEEIEEDTVEAVP